MTMFCLFHVNKINDDNATNIAQSKFPRDSTRRFQIGSEQCFLEIVSPDITPSVDIDCSHRFRLL